MASTNECLLEKVYISDNDNETLIPENITSCCACQRSPTSCICDLKNGLRNGVSTGEFVNKYDNNVLKMIAIFGIFSFLSFNFTGTTVYKNPIFIKTTNTIEFVSETVSADDIVEEAYVKPVLDEVLNLVSLNRRSSIEEATENCTSDFTINNNNHSVTIEMNEKENNCINNRDDISAENDNNDKCKKKVVKKDILSNDPKLGLNISVKLEKSKCVLKSHQCPSQVTSRKGDENGKGMPLDNLCCPTNDVDDSASKQRVSKVRNAVFPDQLDYELLKGKKGVELLTAIEKQTNANLVNMDMCFSSSDFSDRESPRKTQRTRSVESVFVDQPKQPQGVKRPRSVDLYLSRRTDSSSTTESSITCNIGPTECKIARLNVNSETSKSTESPQIASKNSHHRDKSEHRTSGGHSRSSRSDHSSKRRSSHSDKKKSHRNTVGIQVHQRDQHRSGLKLMDPRPILTINGNLWYPPSEVSILIRKIKSNKMMIVY